MLNAEESARFEEAMHDDPALRSAALEMDRLSAAIAATVTQPVEPKPAQFERLQSRLGLRPAHHFHFRMAVAGWSSAAVLAVLLTLHLTGIIDQWTFPSSTASIATTAPNSDRLSNTSTPSHSDDPSNPMTPGLGSPDGAPPIKVETMRLNQEIEVLRENLEKYQIRDRAVFEALPGMAVPIIMSMNPPGMVREEPLTLTKNDELSSLTTLLGNALTAINAVAADTPASPLAGLPGARPALPEHPTGIPIYDAARDAGTLVVSNLPPADDDAVYNLWVTTHAAGTPVFVGSLPENCASGEEAFDFSLGSTTVLPSGFILTLDPVGAPATPTESNTILHGPPTPGH